MIYRKFGNTGVNISSLGFGCMRLPEVQKDGKWYIDEDKALPLLYSGYEKGINYFDSAFYYCHSNSEAAVGKALKSVRDQVNLTSKCPLGDVKEPGDYRRFLETSLKRMDTDHIDFYHFWGINKDQFDNKILKLDLIKEAVKAKEEGLIRHISFSFHDDPKVIAYILEKAPEMETILLQYNLLDRSNEEMIDYAAEKGLGVVAMGPVGGGRLAAPTDLYKKLTGKESKATYELALRFVLGNKNISCALSGMGNTDMLEKNAAVASDAAPMTEAEFEQIKESLEQLKKFNELYCTGCSYCQPCPKNIVIPRLFEMYTYHNVYGLSQAAKEQYKNYVEGKEGGLPADCINCGFCERKCPQKIQIRSELKRVEGILKSL